MKEERFEEGLNFKFIFRIFLLQGGFIFFKDAFLFYILSGSNKLYGICKYFILIFF